MSGNPHRSALLTKRIINRLGRPFGINPFPRAFPNQSVDSGAKPDEVFNQVYRVNYWGSSQSRSGVGSEVAFAASYRRSLGDLFQKAGIQKVFDAPCGDLNWMAQLISERNIDYIGGDISALVIEDARSRHPDLDLRVFDITVDEFPDADVWHCRDCLFHLPFEAIWAALERYLHSKIPCVLITSHRARLLHRNLDVGFGGFRVLDFERPPFSLPRPVARVPDYVVGTDFPRYVCLWTREQLAGRLNNRASNP